MNLRPPLPKRPTWTDDAAWVIEPQSTLRLGSVDDDSTEIFVDVSQAILLPEGRIAVADNGMGSVRVFDAEGRLLVSFGKKGDGPGEFRRLSVLSRYRGDSLLTVDLSKGAVSVWSEAGELGRTRRLIPPVASGLCAAPAEKRDWAGVPVPTGEHGVGRRSSVLGVAGTVRDHGYLLVRRGLEVAQPAA